MPVQRTDVDKRRDAKGRCAEVQWHPFFVDASSGRLTRRTHLPVRPYIAGPCIAGLHVPPRFLPLPPSAPRLPLRTVTVFFAGVSFPPSFFFCSPWRRPSLPCLSRHGGRPFLSFSVRRPLPSGVFPTPVFPTLIYYHILYFFFYK